MWRGKVEETGIELVEQSWSTREESDGEVECVRGEAR